jgi:cysteine dioxygenase type I
MHGEPETTAQLTDIGSWLRERLPVGEDLDRPTLAALATELGRERSLWESLVRHDPVERYYIQLYRDVHLDVWMICWLNQQDTGFHDHDVSSGAVYVTDGVLAEDLLRRSNGTIAEVVNERAAGTVFDFDAAHIHRMRHPEGGGPATSVHFYSPALWRMGYYEPDDEGNLRRISITYVDEMGAGHPWSP